MHDKDETLFSIDERKTYFKKKWRKEHIALYVVMVLILTAVVVIPFAFGKPFFAGLAPLIAIGEHAYQNNKMMIYVEKKIYE